MEYDVGFNVETVDAIFYFIDKTEIESPEIIPIEDIKMEIAAAIRDGMESRDVLVFINESQNPVILQVKDIKSIEVVCDEVVDTD